MPADARWVGDAGRVGRTWFGIAVHRTAKGTDMQVRCTHRHRAEADARSCGETMAERRREP